MIQDLWIIIILYFVAPVINLPWGKSLSFLHLTFLICTVRLIIVTRCIVVNIRNEACKTSSFVLGRVGSKYILVVVVTHIC